MGVAYLATPIIIPASNLIRTNEKGAVSSPRKKLSSLEGRLTGSAAWGSDVIRDERFCGTMHAGLCLTNGVEHHRRHGMSRLAFSSRMLGVGSRN